MVSNTEYLSLSRIHIQYLRVVKSDIVQDIIISIFICIRPSGDSLVHRYPTLHPYHQLKIATCTRNLMGSYPIINQVYVQQLPHKQERYYLKNYPINANTSKHMYCTIQMQHHSSDASLGINHCDEKITPLDTSLGDQEDKRGRQSHDGGPVQLKLESISDFRSSPG